MTYDRFIAMGIEPHHIWVLTSDEHETLVRHQLPHIEVNHIIREPMRRNTAPAAYIAAQALYSACGDEPMMVVPSDHLIDKVQSYEEIIRQGVDYVRDHDVLLTIGVEPDRPHTGYGYIQYDEKGSPPYHVLQFVEKPSLQIAQSYVDSGRFLWNTGMFLWRPSVLIQVYHQYAPEICRVLSQVNFHELDKLYQSLMDVYEDLPNISIDYAIMERAESVYTFPSDIGWTDIGSWQAYFEYRSNNQEDSVIVAHKTILDQSRGNLVFAPDKKVVLSGLEGYMIIAHDDVIMVCPMTEDQRVKTYSEEMDHE